MTEEKYKEIKTTKESIENLEGKLRTINRISKACSIQCTVEGTQHGCSNSIKYITFNKNEIFNLLSIEKQIIESKLIELNKIFTEQ